MVLGIRSVSLKILSKVILNDPGKRGKHRYVSGKTINELFNKESRPLFTFAFLQEVFT